MMTQDEIIRSPLGREQLVALAREAGFEVNYYKSLESEEVVSFDPIITYNLERFAALVAAHERNRHAWTQEHWTEYEHAIAAAEREACAKVCEEGTGEAVQKTTLEILLNERKRIAKAIRDRGDE